MDTNYKKAIRTFIVPLLWALAVTYGMWQVLNYEKTPGATALQTPMQWPAQAPSATPEGATLVLFVHPQCPCTKATIGELMLLMSRCPKGLTAYLFFLSPPGFPEDWSKGSLWQEAERIPNVRLFQDKDGEVARYFGATTSGQSFLYGQAGELLFEGGITAARGHRGDNAGRSAIQSIILQGHSQTKRTSVFGCALFNQPMMKK